MANRKLNIGPASSTAMRAGTGLWLKALSAIPDMPYPELWLGFGWSVILQGAFLLVHDNIFHYLHRVNFRKCKPFLEDVMETQIALRRMGV